MPCGLVALNAPHLATIAVNAHPTTRILLLPFSNAQALQLPSQLLLRFFRAPQGLRRDNLSTGPEKTEPKPVGVCGFLKGISKVFKICILGSSRYVVDSAFSRSCLETDLLRQNSINFPASLPSNRREDLCPKSSVEFVNHVRTCPIWMGKSPDSSRFLSLQKICWKTCKWPSSFFFSVLLVLWQL